MKDPAARYLAKRAQLETRPLVAGSLEGIAQVVVIPIRDERESLPETLASLARNPQEALARTLIVGVVNNGLNDCAENEFALALLRNLVDGQGGDRFSGLRAGYIDGSTEGHAFAPKEGVGLARKLGLDWGVQVLQENGVPRGALICLDADTLVEANYLASLGEHFRKDVAWAAVVAYEHPLEGSPEAQSAIACYELFLRYHVLGLTRSRSPYAFPTIGSTIACTAEAYVAVSGMNRRQGGEDFYFLQELRKTGPVDVLSTTKVYPSPRPSDRVPFGTGPRVERFLRSTDRKSEFTAYHPDSYEILRGWLQIVTLAPRDTAESLIEKARRHAPQLAEFLRGQHFDRTWERLQQNAADDAALLEQFHRWFDAFKALKLLHHLRDHGYPDQDMRLSIETLLARMGHEIPAAIPCEIHDDLDGQKALLSHLRTLS